VSKLQPVRGTHDLLPDEYRRFAHVVDISRDVARLYGYREIATPIFEFTELFARGIGEATDVVSKEMYTFSDRGERSLTLRPEGTAGVVRAVLEHNLHRGQLPVKVWYAGPFFRAERPQAGRYRQFSQVGIEAIGSDDPAVDAEVVTIAYDGYRGLGLQRFSLALNSLGDAQCRPAYREKLQEFLRALDLDEDTRRRVEINPLRVLDDKRDKVRDQVLDAPLIGDHLCDDCRRHYDEVRGFLVDLGVQWREEPRLVRGLDYYTRTTFEFVHDGLGAQSGIGGGGRYDGLSETLGGPPLPGIGFGLGVDRTLLALQSEDDVPTAAAGAEVFAVPLGAAAKRELVKVVGRLRRGGVAADLAYGDRGLKGAMKAADRSGARLAIVVGDRDLADGLAQLKDLTTGEQEAVALSELVAAVEKRLS
jgi:histidyl-tRNA synthetase